LCELRIAWGEIKAGVSGQVTPNTTIYANACYQSRCDGGGFRRQR
jgi:outer membrane autotransporter protein